MHGARAPRLSQPVGELLARELVQVLKLEELVAAVPRQVDQHAAPRAAAQPPGRGCVRRQSVGQHTQEGLGRHFGAAVVDLNVGTVEVRAVEPGVHHAARRGVPCVARHVARKHEHDLAVRHAERPDRVVHGQRARDMAVVVPVLRATHDHGPHITALAHRHPRSRSTNQPRFAHILVAPCWWISFTNMKRERKNRQRINYDELYYELPGTAANRTRPKQP